MSIAVDEGSCRRCQRPFALPASRKRSTAAIKNQRWPLASTTADVSTAMLVLHGSRQSPGVRDMQQVRISKGHRAARARSQQEGEQVLPLDPRDPDITRAKQLQKAARSGASTARGGNST
jgi:hypothetical protein